MSSFSWIWEKCPKCDNFTQVHRVIDTNTHEYAKQINCKNCGFLEEVTKIFANGFWVDKRQIQEWEFDGPTP